jgi:hypothetical protein
MPLALYPYALISHRFDTLALLFFFPGEQVKQIRNDAFVHPQSIYKTIDALWDGEI